MVRKYEIAFTANGIFLVPRLKPDVSNAGYTIGERYRQYGDSVAKLNEKLKDVFASQVDLRLGRAKVFYTVDCKTSTIAPSSEDLRQYLWELMHEAFVSEPWFLPPEMFHLSLVPGPYWPDRVSPGLFT